MLYISTGFITCYIYFNRLLNKLLHLKCNDVLRAAVKYEGGTTNDNNVIMTSAGGRWHWLARSYLHTGSHLSVCAHPPPRTYARNSVHMQTNTVVSKTAHTVTLTPLAAAICTMTSIAVRLKKRPSPPTTMVEPWRSRRSMEEKILWMKLCR